VSCTALALSTRGGADERQDLAGEQALVDRLAHGLAERHLVGMVQHPRGAEQREGSGPDAGVIRGDAQGVLPVEVDPAPPGRLPVGGVVLHASSRPRIMIDGGIDGRARFGA
jgi:hypothetical protein